MNTASHDLAELNVACEQKITSLLDTLRRWCERRGYDGELKIILNSHRLTCEKQVTLTPAKSDTFSRSTISYLERPLSEDEIGEIAAVNWSDQQRKIVSYIFSHQNQPLAPADLDRIIIANLDEWTEHELKANNWYIRHKRKDFIAMINARFRKNGQPYRLTWPLDVEAFQGPYRFYRIIKG